MSDISRQPVSKREHDGCCCEQYFLQYACEIPKTEDREILFTDQRDENSGDVNATRYKDTQRALNPSECTKTDSEAQTGGT